MKRNKEIKITLEVDNTDKALDEMDDKRETILTAIGALIEDYATLLAPEDTGRLRDSITYKTKHTSDDVRPRANSGDDVKGKLDDMSVIVGSNVEYAAYQEKGTFKHKVGVSPFLRPAIENHINEYNDIIKETLEK